MNKNTLDKKTNILLNLVLLVVGVYFGYKIVFQTNPWQFYDFVNLFIHEAGHLIFSPFGNVMQFLGGTIMQLLFPLIFLGYFFTKKMYSGVAFCMFWLGENLINVAYYMKDAKEMRLDLVGGGIHDWNWIFSHFGVLGSYEQIASFTKSLGLFFTLLSITILLYLIFNGLTKAPNR